MARPPRHLIAGNWKMNLVRNDAIALVCDLVTRLETAGGSGCDMAVCPPALLLPTVAEALGKSGIQLGGQDCHAEPSGAHTGDIAAAMLADAGCACVIVGHSERRADHGEDDAMVRAKAKAVQDCGMTAIICIGETLAERDSGKTLRVVSGQLNASLPMGAGAANTVIAYEPVWAIGTGRTPTPDQVAEVHASIRGDLEKRLAGADQVRILYGGSVKPDNAAELMALANVNGALVGGASLNAGDFWAICESCPSVQG